MIRALLRNDDGTFTVVFGLSDTNLTRIANGDPLVVNLARLGGDDTEATGLPDITIVVMTDDQLAEFAVAHNALPDPPSSN